MLPSGESGEWRDGDRDTIGRIAERCGEHTTFVGEHTAFVGEQTAFVCVTSACSLVRGT
jgi:hypothetical protein